MSGEEKARSTLLFSGSGKKLAWVGCDSRYVHVCVHWGSVYDSGYVCGYVCGGRSWVQSVSFSVSGEQCTWIERDFSMCVGRV